MDTRALSLGLPALSVLLLLGCPSKEGHSTWPPPYHRAVASECSSDRPPGRNDGPDAGSSPHNDCTNDSDCTSGRNGRCVLSTTGMIPSWLCDYDECVSDRDCGPDQICVCGGAGLPTRLPHACVQSTCRVDADCGPGGFCSPQAGCFVRQRTYHCHSPSDVCTISADCGARSSCSADSTGSTWMCTPTLLSCPHLAGSPI